jgi:hypothetical protein
VGTWDSILIPRAMELLNQSLMRVDEYVVTEIDVVRRIFRVEYTKHTRDMRLLTFRTVSVLEKSCSCGCWQDSGFPGVHPLAVFHFLRKQNRASDSDLFYGWVDTTYRVSNARQAYMQSVITPSVLDIEKSESYLTQNGWKPDQPRNPGGQRKVQKRLASIGEVRRG